MDKVISCAFNIDIVCVEVTFQMQYDLHLLPCNRK